MKPYIYLLLISLYSLFIGGCIKSNRYEKNISIKHHSWKSADSKRFTFNISDTNATYHLFFLMRHTDRYLYSNIWLQIKTFDPNQKLLSDVKVEVPLAQYDGKWLGRGMNEIWEHKMPLTNESTPLHFTNKGMYTITLNHIMRTDPLPDVMSVGMGLEKILQ